MSEQTERWTVGDATVTAIVESEIPGIPPELFFPDGTAEEVRRHPELVPLFAAEDGTIGMRFQAFVIDLPGRCILVDPCVGNGKRRALPFWHEQRYPWLERLTDAGFDPARVDQVLHTHLHPDHVGWGTILVDGEWRPTFTSARYVYVERELEHWRTEEQRQNEDVYADSVEPVIDAGMADLVASDCDFGDGLRFVSTPGHTPGHVSLRIERQGERAVISGDLLHHPVQLAVPEWREIGDWDVEQARTTRAAFFAEQAASGDLVLGTHFPGCPAGRIAGDGDRWRFDPQPGEVLTPSRDEHA